LRYGKSPLFILDEKRDHFNLSSNPGHSLLTTSPPTFSIIACLASGAGRDETRIRNPKEARSQVSGSNLEHNFNQIH